MHHIGIVGCGGIAKHHVGYLQYTPHVRVAALFDAHQPAAQRLSEVAGGQVCASLDDLLAHEPLDAVMVCSPTLYHAEAAISALKAGKHVFIEKPIARTLEQCDAIAAAAAQSRGSLTVGMIRRFDNEWITAMRIVAEGRLGRPAIWRLAQGSHRPSSSWFTRDDVGGGPFLDAAIHNYDCALRLFGPVRRVMGVGSLWDAERNSGVDTGSLIVEHAAGDQTVIIWTWGMQHGGASGRFTDVIGPKGGMRGVYAEQMPAGKPFTAFGGFAVTTTAGSEIVTYAKNDMYADQLAAWLQFIEKGEPCAAPMSEIRDGLRVALLALDALKGRCVCEW